MDLNFEKLHLFFEGMKNTREQHSEEDKSYEYGLNGRLHSENGKLSYSSIKGTKVVYNNPKIVKYLGYFSFLDELVVFVKYDDTVSPVTSETTFTIEGQNKIIEIPFGSSQHQFTDELSNGAIENITNTTVEEILQPENPLEDNYNEIIIAKTIDLSTYYTLSGKNIPNYKYCTIDGTYTIPEYNKEYMDAIIVLKTSGLDTLTGRVAWKGNMNWDINRKITTVGIYENNYYKRVYFTDNLNPLRVVNLKDNALPYRTSSEFDIKQNATLLQPTIQTIKNGGSLQAMSVQYAYRLITENGQVSVFSPYSDLIYILKDDDGFDFAGGEIDEITSKMVVIECPVVSTQYSEIQCIAIEYKADTIPTAIRNLGKKSVSDIVEFVHTGNENEFSDNITIDDIIETSQIWTYCNDITSKRNKLIAAGLRNEPYAIQEKYVEDLFLFKGFDALGNTHDSLINPEPQTYRYVDPSNTEDSIYLKKQLYNRFLFFGNVTLTLNNKSNANAQKSITFKSSSDQYIEYIDEIWEWLNGLNLDLYPNLQITRSNISILFSPIDELIETDLSDYYFSTSVSQAIIDFENEYSLISPTVTLTNLIYGAQSVGFNKGTGVRVSFEEKSEPILNKSPELYQSGALLNLKEPSLQKTFVKDEIYRLSIQFFKKGNPLFAIVLGDVKTPALNEEQRYIDSDGQIVTWSNLGYTGDSYKNQSVENDILYVHRLGMKVEVRIPCEFKDYVDSYQIQYVQRTENNRTILAQGISAPLVRVTSFGHPGIAGIAYAPDVYDKWTLPFNGGPLYNVNGLLAYDEVGENWNDQSSLTEWNGFSLFPDYKERVRKREMVNRKMFYFDSPDIIYNRITANNIANGKAVVVGRINTDHTQHLIRSRYILNGETSEVGHATDYGTNGYPEIYKDASFSRKIGFKQISGSENQKPYHVNVSIFSEYTPYNQEHSIEKASAQLAKGEMIPSIVLGTTFSASNKALSLMWQSAYNSGLWLSGMYSSKKGWYYSESHQSSQNSNGYPTVFIRTEDELFTDDLIGPQRNNPIPSSPHTGSGNSYLTNVEGFASKYVPTTDTHAIINIKMDNIDSIYGGRNKYAYSQNIFIPLGPVIPLKGSTSDTQSQKFDVQGDFYTSLFLRAKNDMSSLLEAKEHLMHQDDQYGGDSRSIEDFNRGAAWAYGVVLETEVESRLTSDYRFFRASGSIDFSSDVFENINSAYYKKNNLRVYSPVPYNFKDDPLMINMISASETKLSGDYYDAWTKFLLNEFYELEKSKGIITNITNWKDELFAIQETETNQVSVDTTNFITTQEGENVAIKKGDGRTFTSHKKISDFGTSIRRALAEGESGFSFFDEKNTAFVKFGESLSLPKEIEFKLRVLFENDKIIDTEGYYDNKYKETNIRIRTENGMSYMLSFNELLKVFNGWIAYDNDIYMVFSKRVFSPNCGVKTITYNLPEITSQLTVEMQVGKYSEYQILTNELQGKGTTPVPNDYTATNLPDGLNINTATGLIYGVPTTVGTTSVPIVVTNSAGVSQVILIIIVNPATLFGESNGSSEVIGVIGYLATIEIQGVSNAKADVYGKLKAKGFLIVTINGVATINSILIGTGYFDVEINGSSTVTGQMEAVGSLLGISNGVTSIVGEIEGKNYIYAVSNNTVVVAGELLQPLEFTGYATTYDITNDCRILVTGTYSQYGTPQSKQAVNDIAIIDSCGNLDETFNANIGSGFNDFMYWGYGSTISHDGSIFVGGSFTTFNGVSTNRLLKLNPDGTRDWSFDIGTGFNKASATPLVDKDGSVFYFGRFDTYKGAWRGQIAKISPNGTLDPTFSGYFTSNIPIQLMDAGYNKMIAHGYTVGYNGSYIPHIVRIDKTTGDRDWTFNVPVGPDIAGEGKVMYSIMDGEKIIMVSQFFTQWDNLPAGGIVRLNRDGSRDETFNMGTGFAGGVVYKVALFEGKYIVAGTFASYNGTACSRLVRLNQDGTLDNTFDYKNANGDYGPYNIVVMGENIYVSEARAPGTYQYILVVDRDGNAKRMKKNPNGCIPFSCSSRLRGLIEGQAYNQADLGVRPNDQIVGISNGGAIVSADLTNLIIITEYIQGETNGSSYFEATTYVQSGVVNYSNVQDMTGVTKKRLASQFPIEEQAIKVDVFLNKIGSPDHDLKFFLTTRNNNNNNPTFLIVESPTVYNTKDLVSGEQWVSFEIPKFEVEKLSNLKFIMYMIDFDTNVVLRDTSNYMKAYYSDVGIGLYNYTWVSDYWSYSTIANRYLMIREHYPLKEAPRLIPSGPSLIEGSININSSTNSHFDNLYPLPYEEPYYRKSSFYPVESRYGIGFTLDTLLSQGKSRTVTSVKFYVKKIGSPDYNLGCKILKHNVAVIEEVYEVSSTVIHSSAIGTTGMWVEFIFTGKTHHAPAFMLVTEDVVTKNSTNYIGIAAIDCNSYDEFMPTNGIRNIRFGSRLMSVDGTAIGSSDHIPFIDVNYASDPISGTLTNATP